MLPTCAVTCNVYDQSGNPERGATITARLSSYEVYQGYVVPNIVTGTTDSNGICVLNLWPNQLGAVESLYRITISPKTGRSLRTTATVPNQSTALLHLISELPPYDGKTDGQLILDEAVAAGAVAVSKAAEASASATAAATSETNAATSESNAALSESNAQASSQAAVSVLASVSDVVSGLEPTVTQHSGDGFSTEIILPVFPSSETVVDVYISGIYQQKATYSVAGQTITFASAPPLGTNNIEVKVSPHVAFMSPASEDYGLITSLPESFEDYGALV